MIVSNHNAIGRFAFAENNVEELYHTKSIQSKFYAMYVQINRSGNFGLTRIFVFMSHSPRFCMI